MEWYYSKSGVQMGPISREELLHKKQIGEVAVTEMVWKQGMAEWQPLAQVPELAAGVIGAAPPFATVGGLGAGEKIPNYLWQSIAVTVLCCLPFGIVAIVYAAKVDGFLAKGDFAGAKEASRMAKLWVNISAGIFLLFVVIAFIGAVLDEM